MFNLFRKKPKQLQQNIPQQYTPQQLGYIIAGGLHHHFSKDSFAKEEREHMRAAVVPEVDYWLASISLAGFSAEWAIVKLLAGRPERDFVRKGYWDGWQAFASKSGVNYRAFQTYKVQKEAYAIATDKLENQMAGTIGNPVVDQFMAFLAENLDIDIYETTPIPHTDSARITALYFLSNLAGQAIPDTYLEVASMVLTDGKLISTPQR